MNGIFNVNKPGGMSSHSVVYTLRQASGIARVGHAGTLDPMATGVLLVCVGQAVRVTEYLTDHAKRYRARVRLGVETDTYDATGTVIAERPVTATRQDIARALGSFVGTLAQLPPAYSAIKREGVRLYKLARRGVETERTPRVVEVYSIDVRAIALPEVEFDVHCGKGTYIRSLAHDLGEKLGCGAHLVALTRLASGEFTLEDALSLDALCEAFARGEAARYLIPLDAALREFASTRVEPGIARQIRQGGSLTVAREFATPLLRVYSTSGEFIALMERGGAPGVWKPKKVFAS